jgi:hypothetical protein
VYSRERKCEKGFSWINLKFKKSPPLFISISDVTKVIKLEIKGHTFQNLNPVFWVTYFTFTYTEQVLKKLCHLSMVMVQDGKFMP